MHRGVTIPGETPGTTEQNIQALSRQHWLFRLLDIILPMLSKGSTICLRSMRTNPSKETRTHAGESINHAGAFLGVRVP
jgi:hypothetical protein